MIALTLLSLLLATTTLAAPSQRRGSTFHGACSVPASAFSLPSSLSPIQSPPSFTTVAFGVQNYTCTSAGNYSSVGTVARLFDASCLYGKQEFLSIQEEVFDIWSGCPTQDPSDPGMAQLLKEHWNIDLIIDYYFVQLNGSLVPVFDATSEPSSPAKGNPNAILFAKKIEDVASPDGEVDIDWVVLQEVSGELANDVYRIHTVKGQPPASCTPGSPDISVKYTAIYVFVDN